MICKEVNNKLFNSKKKTEEIEKMRGILKMTGKRTGKKGKDRESITYH